jgi:hypothetical protein
MPQAFLDALKGRKAYFVMDTERNEDGELKVLIAVENHPGFFKTDWFYGRDLAKAHELVRLKNEGLGLTAKDAQAIVDSSIEATIKASRFSQ